jgi:hypothetical protein
MATPGQIKFIHVLIGKIALPDEHYRDMLSAYNVTSSASPEFAIEQANELIDSLIAIAGEKGIEVATVQNATFKKADVFIHLKTLGNRRGYATYGQLCKIVMLWWEVSTMATDIGIWTALNNFVKNKWQIERLEWLPIEAVSKVIRTLEAMHKTKEDRCPTLNT